MVNPAADTIGKGGIDVLPRTSNPRAAGNILSNYTTALRIKPRWTKRMIDDEDEEKQN